MPTRPFQAFGHEPPGRTYFVDATLGLDANCGTAGYPLQTIAAVNALALKPGDQVLFKRGESWSGTRLTVPANGDPGKHIVFGTYGVGARPILTHTGGTFFVTGKHHITIKGLNVIAGAASQHCIRVETAAHNIWIDDCECSGFKTAAFTEPASYNGISASVTGGGMHDIWITNNIVHDNGESGICPTGASDRAYNILIAGNTCYDNGAAGGTANHGIYCSYITGLRILRNLCYNNQDRNIQVRADATDFLIEFNTCYGARTLTGISILDLAVTPNNGIVRNNLCYLNKTSGIFVGTNCVGNLIEFNTCVNNGDAASSYGIEMGVSTVLGNTVRNNISFQDLAIVGAASGRQPLRCNSQAVADGNTFDNNLYFFLGDPAAGVANIAGSSHTMAQWQAEAAAPDAHGVNADPKFASVVYTTVDADSASGQKVLNVASTAGYNAGEKIWIGQGTARMEQGVIDTIQAGVSLTLLANLTQTHTGAQADVVQSCVYTNLHLQSTSPAIGAADATVGVVNDFDGVARGAVTDDVGAYKYV